MNPKKKPLMIATVAACVLLGGAVLVGAGDLVVYPLALAAVASVGGLIYLARTVGR
ncbi:hypothetical protein PWG71_25500 [Nocardiopsis sp. N85]|uniref:hypothetical protein n=1 Tax=Nocardiopsis sp. N85 TaxID=3029400 RepID=UPI00237FA96F|nr:hypothetical protein [Nocardiopsis sp. N85]MDE3724756.1 hypothetical protein [Nocardiopsis sp. N85]